MLIEAFRLYVRAARERRAKTRAELILLANLLVGYHEQTRLQDPIAGALATPWTALRAILPRVASGLPRACLAWFQRLQQTTRRLLTRAFMTLELPETAIGLGRDMLPIGPDRDFPPDLMDLRCPRLLALVDKLDRTPNTVVGSAADDWACLDDRMNFVVDYFRSRQQDERLFRCPLTPAQRAVVSRALR